MNLDFHLPSQIGQFILSLVLSLLVLSIAKRRGFFSHPFGSDALTYPPTFLHVLGAFAIYFFFGLIIALFSVTIFQFGGFEASIARVSWISFITAGGVLLGLLLLFRLISKPVRMEIWGRKCSSRDLLISLATWVVAFPLVTCVGQILTLLVYFIFHVHQLPDQIAVKLVKLSFEHPLYFLMNAISIIVFAPLIEEILFRGFFQNYLRRFLSSKIAISVTSIFFAFLHYASDQKFANIPLLGSLFVFSCFLGFIYERQRSLSASISLHVIFNFLSLATLYFFESS